MFISIHIPKTAGTTLAYIFDYGSNRRIMYDYRDDYTNSTMDDLDFWRLHKPFIEKQFDFIHGHFFYEKYADLFPEGRFLVCLRHPVERIISQFNHVYFEANPDDWQYRAMIDDGLDIVEYAKLDGVHNAQALHVAGREIKDFDYVFVSETLRRDIFGFQLTYGFERNDSYVVDGLLPRLNSRTEKVDITQAEMNAIYNAAEEDVEIYRQGAERAEDLIRAVRLG